jgi:hypothetical protein
MNLRDFQTPLISALLGALLALSARALAGIWRRCRLRWKLSLEPQERVGSRVTARICNGYAFPLNSVWAYITITHELSDILPPPNGAKAYVGPSPGDRKLVQEDRLCWSFTGNPAVIDIYPGEKQSLDVAGFDSSGKWIEIPSEDGWGSELAKGKSSRVFLDWKRYSAKIKIVCKDTKSKEFNVEIDPDNQVAPLSLRKRGILQFF